MNKTFTFDVVVKFMPLRIVQIVQHDPAVIQDTVEVNQVIDKCMYYNMKTFLRLAARVTCSSESSLSSGISNIIQA